MTDAPTEPSPQEALERPLVWIDLEMTGLDPDRDLIVEIATIVTDGGLERSVEGPDLVVHVADEVLSGMDDVVTAMHESSGLTSLIRTATTTLAEAERQTLEFVRSLVPEPRTAPLAGNSVHADRAFLHRHMPDLEAHLHYRNVDVSTFKEVSRRWAPQLLAGAPRKGGSHRALADIRESIEELRYYRDALYRPLSGDGRPPADAPGDDPQAEDERPEDAVSEGG